MNLDPESKKIKVDDCLLKNVLIIDYSKVKKKKRKKKIALGNTEV